MRIISLGWGVQSFTLAAMSALGDLPPIDVALHADTTHERSATYEFAAKWTPWLEARGIRVVTVKASGKRLNPIDAHASKSIVIPAYTMDQEAHVRGMLRRQCTGEWKIAPMRRWLQANRQGMLIEQWLGISIDEAPRMRDSDVTYIVNRYPLIELRKSRIGCITWLQEHDLEIPNKSACVFCPYHDKMAWQEMRSSNGTDWNIAVATDAALRIARPPFDLFIHRDCLPLSEAVKETPEDAGQLNLWMQTCESGYCWT